MPLVSQQWSSQASGKVATHCMLPLVVVMTVGIVLPTLATGTPGSGAWKQAKAQSPGAAVFREPWASMPEVLNSMAPEMPCPWLSTTVSTRLQLVCWQAMYLELWAAVRAWLLTEIV